MKITKVEYSKTFNLGNYQSAKIGYEAEVDVFGTESREENQKRAHEALMSLVKIVDNERGNI